MLEPQDPRPEYFLLRCQLHRNGRERCLTQTLASAHSHSRITCRNNTRAFAEIKRVHLFFKGVMLSFIALLSLVVSQGTAGRREKGEGRREGVIVVAGGSGELSSTSTTLSFPLLVLVLLLLSLSLPLTAILPCSILTLASCPSLRIPTRLPLPRGAHHTLGHIVTTTGRLRGEGGQGRGRGQRKGAATRGGRGKG